METNSLIDEFMNSIEDMRFRDVDDLFIKKANIRKLYGLLEFNNQEMYKWYFFYQLCLLREPLRTCIWEYVIGKDNVNELNIAYINFCNKRDKLRNM